MAEMRPGRWPRLRAWLLSEYVWAPVTLGLLSLLFLGQYLNPPPGQYLGGGDVVAQLAQLLRLARSEVAAGRLPLWNPYLASGMPLWANPQPGLLYPPNWILLWAPLNAGISWLKAAHMAWTGLGMYVWARGQGFRPGGALVGALTFSFSGFMAVRVADGHPNTLAVLAWLPWVMAALDRSFRQGTVRSALLAALPLALTVYAGNPAMAVLVVGLAVVWTAVAVVWRRWPAVSGSERWYLPARQLAIAGLAAMLLAAAQLLPTLELIARSSRAATSYAFASEYALPLGHLISIVAPNFFGEPVRLGYWGEGGLVQTEYLLYPGLLALLLVAVALRHGGSTRWVQVWVVLAVVGLLLALGPAGGLHPLAYNAIPGLGLARAPARVGGWSLFSVARLAAWSVDDLLRHPASHWVSTRAIAVLAGAPALAAIVAFLVYTLAPREDARAYHAGAALLMAGLVFGLAGGLLRARPVLSAPAFLALAVLLTLADLWGYGVGELRWSSAGQDSTWAPAATLIGAPGAVPPPRVAPFGLGLFQENLAMDAGLASTNAYDPLVPRDYAEFTASVPDPRATTFDLLSAEYALIPAGETQWRDDPRLDDLGPAGDYAVYRRRSALPRAWVAPAAQAVGDLRQALALIHAPGFEPTTAALIAGAASCPAGSGGSAAITGYTASRVTLAPEGSGTLVLSETWYPGWRARIDGRPARVLQVDGVLRGVCLPAGAREVIFEFDPPLVKVGLAVTALALAALAWLAATAVRRGAREREKEAAAAAPRPSVP
jgi:hypothetical protein